MLRLSGSFVAHSDVSVFFFEIAWSSTERSATRALRVPLGRPEVASPRGGLLCGTLMVIGYRWVVACVRSAGIIFMTTHRLCAVYHSDVRRYTKDCSCLAMPKNPSLRKIERRKKRHGAICCNYCFFCCWGLWAFWMAPKTDQNPPTPRFGGPGPCETAQTRIPSPAHVFTPLRDAVISSGVRHFMFICCGP